MALILVVEDNEANVELISRFLRRSGHRVLIVDLTVRALVTVIGRPIPTGPSSFGIDRSMNGDELRIAKAIRWRNISRNWNSSSAGILSRWLGSGRNRGSRKVRRRSRSADRGPLVMRAARSKKDQ